MTTIYQIPILIAILGVATAALVLFGCRPEAKPAKVVVPTDNTRPAVTDFTKPVVHLPLCVAECSAGTGV